MNRGRSFDANDTRWLSFDWTNQRTRRVSLSLFERINFLRRAIRLRKSAEAKVASIPLRFMNHLLHPARIDGTTIADQVARTELREPRLKNLGRAAIHLLSQTIDCVTQSTLSLLACRLAFAIGICRKHPRDGGLARTDRCLTDSRCWKWKSSDSIPKSGKSPQCALALQRRTEDLERSALVVGHGAFCRSFDWGKSIGNQSDCLASPMRGANRIIGNLQVAVDIIFRKAEGSFESTTLLAPRASG